MWCLENAGFSRKIIPLFPNKKIKNSFYLRNHPWVYMEQDDAFLRLSETKVARCAHTGQGGSGGDGRLGS